MNFSHLNTGVWLYAEINKDIVFKGEMKQHIDSSIEYHLEIGSLSLVDFVLLWIPYGKKMSLLKEL